MTAAPVQGEDGLVLHQHDARGVHRLTLNSPKSFNVLGEAVLGELQRQFDAIAADPTARVLVIAAEGKAFCAGHDLKQMKANPQLAYYQRLFAQCSKMMMSIQKLPMPVIARVQGLDTARFGVNGIDVGLFCATPSVPLVRNMQPKQAMEMLLTGGFIDAEEARARGLVNRVVPAEQLDAAVDALVNAILAKPREAIAAGKELFYRQSELGIEAAYQLAGQTMACNMMLDVAQEGVQAFIDKREPTWRRPAP